MAPTPRQLSRELRTHHSPDLERRRWTVGLSFVGTAVGMVVGLYQMGVFRRLPDLPTPYTDASRVDASDYAYKRMQTPDGLIMTASYAVTAILAGAGGEDRARENPALPIALAAKTIYDAGIALKLAQEEWAENRAFCTYCQAATVASIASVALSLPEAMRAVEHLAGGGRSHGIADAQEDLHPDPHFRFAPDHLLPEDDEPPRPVAPRQRPYRESHAVG